MMAAVVHGSAWCTPWDWKLKYPTLTRKSFEGKPATRVRINQNLRLSNDREGATFKAQFKGSVWLPSA